MNRDIHKKIANPTPPTPSQLENLRLIRFGIGHAPKKIRHAADDLLKTPRLLQRHHSVRFQHFHANDTGRLVGTIATRAMSDGTVDVAAAIVNENQGKNGEVSATRATGCKMALLRLISGNRDGLRFSPTDAAYVLDKGPNTELSGELVSPRDIVVVNFTQQDLASAINSRAVLKAFPGAQWLPKALRMPKPFDKTEAVNPAPATVARSGILQRLVNIFR